MILLLYWILVGILCIALSAYIDDWAEAAGLDAEEVVIATVIVGALTGFLAVFVLASVIVLRIQGKSTYKKPRGK